MEKFVQIRVERDDRGVVTVTLNRPEVHNAFNDTMIEELHAAFEAIGGEKAARLVVLRGAGKSFCAGADLAEMKALKEAGEEENRAQSMRLAAMYHCINRLPLPLVGVVQGAALGGGTGLAAVCDYVITAPRARFGLTEVKLGIVPAVISPYVLAKIGESQARAYFLSGMRFGPEEALRMGLVHQLVEEDALEDAVEGVVTAFLQNGSNAMRLAKQLIAELPAYEDIEQRTAYTSGMIAKARVSDEGQEGMSAFLEKRTAKWNTGV